MDKNKRFIIVAAGIFICYFYFGIFQENITKANYILPDGTTENFIYPMSLVFTMCITNYLFSKLLTTTIISVADDTTRTSYYCSNGLTYILAMICTNMSLQFVSYPTQVIAKSSKPIPVMILGVLLGRKSYTWKKYVVVFLVVSGVALFLYKDKKGPAVESDGIGFGELLLFCSLVMDGLNGAIQERMRAEHQTKSMAMMLNCNFWASIYLLIATVSTGELIEFFFFVQRHPSVIWKFVTLSLANCFGQYFIFMCVSEFGPLPCSIIATVRKLFTVLTSVLFFGNALLPRQWIATVIVFTALFLDIFYSKSSPKKPSKTSAG